MTAPESPPDLIDTHAHLDDPKLRDDLPGVLARAREAGVRQVVAVATTAEDSARVIATAREFPGVFATVGIHPNEAATATDGDWTRVVELSTDQNVVAVGETGLDRHWDQTPFPTQRLWFDRHLELARSRNLPVVIHSREADADIIDQLRRLGRPVSGILHSFTGTWDDAQAYLELGLHLSFAGMLTFTNRSLDALRDVAARAPEDRILVETDSPYLSPHPRRGVANQPSHVAITAARLAGLRGIGVAELAEITSRNSRRLFGLTSEGRARV